MFKLAPLALALIAGVSAIPTAQRPQTPAEHRGGDREEPGRTDYLSTFEDLEVGAAEIGPYNGVRWTNIATDEAAGLLGLIGGFRPRSPPNVALVDADAAITTQYDGTVNELMDLHSFYFACAGGLLDTASPCFVTVIGYRATQEVARQTFPFFALGSGSDVRMSGAVLSDDFKGIDSIHFDADSDDLGGIYLDNVMYTVYAAEN